MTPAADRPLPVDADPDFPRAGLTRYLQAHVPDLAGEVSYFRFTGGNSNLTYLVKGPRREFVLKREPPGEKARGAYDMRREFRMLKSLKPHYPLAPEAALLCEDGTVLGGVFVLMERVDGLIVRDADTATEALPRQFMGLIDALAALHAIDVEGAGLAGLARPEGYRRRQTEGWCNRFQVASEQPVGPSARVIAWLLANIPTDPERASVIHNDFKMDNLVWRTDSPDRLAGVLDWEMATLGDPLMDLACTLSFWNETSDPAPLRALRAMPSAHPGVPSRREALDRYLSQAKASMAEFTFYRCFGLFRRATIEQQKFRRFASGASQDERFRNLDESVRVLLAECEQLIA
jgi:aminoglycoside phosphotransferase (APT) family kinase protein